MLLLLVNCPAETQTIIRPCRAPASPCSSAQNGPNVIRLRGIGGQLGVRCSMLLHLIRKCLWLRDTIGKEVPGSLAWIIHFRLGLLHKEIKLGLNLFLKQIIIYFKEIRLKTCLTLLESALFYAVLSYSILIYPLLVLSSLLVTK